MIVPIVSGKERLKHPTQKPEKIIELFVKYWSNEGGVALDPFVGSGTTMKV
ncbi:MAG: DNA methyltransferase [Candidatus Aenigmatarchaeota archaeon]